VRSKLIASTLILGIAFSILSITLIVGCGTTSKETDGSVTTIPTIYVSDTGNGKVLMIDPSTLQVTGSIEITDASNIQWMVLHPNGGRVYVADNTTMPGRIFIINTATNAVEKTLLVMSSPRGMAFNSDGSKLFVVCDMGGTCTVAVVNTANDTWDDYISMGSQSYGIDYNPRNNSLYVCDDGENELCKVTAEAGSTRTYVDISGINDLYDVVTGPGGHSMYVTSHDGPPDRIISVEADSLTIVASWDATADGARHIILSPDGKRVYAGICDYAYIDCLNIENGVSYESIDVGSTASGNIEQLTFSPDGSRLYAVNNDPSPNQVVVVDTSTNTLTYVVTLPAGSNDCFGIVYRP